MEILLNPLIVTYGAKVIHKDIPFNLPRYEKAWEQYRSGKIIISEEYEHSDPNNLKAAIQYWIVTRIRKAFLSRADALVCYTKDAFEVFPSYEVDVQSIFLIYNSPSTSKLIAAKQEAEKLKPKLPHNPFRLIHVGRLVKWKKVDLLLNTLASLPQEYNGAELIVVGNGPEMENLKQLAVKLGVDQRVFFMGAIYDPVQLARLHLDAAIYVLGGIGGLSINEAMCFGKPVICSEADGTEKMLVKDGQNGYFFTSDDIDDLRLKIVSLLSNPDQIVSFGRESERIVREEVNEKKVLEGYVHAFEFVLNKK